MDVHGLIAVLHQTSNSDVQVVLAYEFAVDGSLHLNAFPNTPRVTLNGFLRAPAFFLRVFAMLACVEISLAACSVSCELHAKIAAVLILTELAADIRHVAFRWRWHVEGFKGVLRPLVDLRGELALGCFLGKWYVLRGLHKSHGLALRPVEVEEVTLNQVTVAHDGLTLLLLILFRLKSFLLELSLIIGVCIAQERHSTSHFTDQLIIWLRLPQSRTLGHDELYKVCCFLLLLRLHFTPLLIFGFS